MRTPRDFTEAFKEMHGRDLLVLLAETDAAESYWESADEGDIYETLEAMGYEWYAGGWYTLEYIAQMKASAQ